MTWLPLVSLTGVGTVISLAVIGGGLLWLLYRSLLAKEVDRRIIFLFIFLSVAAPLLFPITFEEEATPVVKAIFDRIESLPEGSRILISFDFDPAMAPEVQPMAEVVTQHCMVKNHKVIFMCLFATGQALLTQSLDQIMSEQFPDKLDGLDYVNIGFKAGNEGVLNVIVSDFKKMFPTDVNAVPYDSIEVFKGIRSAKDLDMVFTVGGGKPGVKEWVLFVGDPGRVPVAGGVAAVVAPQMYPYYPKQLLGIMGGIKGAAEYESELRKEYPQFEDVDAPGLRMMGPQTLAHMVIMAFIVMGNIAYIVQRRRDGQRKRL
ncbi:hypothetical protein GF356_02615 [candidate division GN15 bacterium]|nr:hypothetical protein [candidate division GN15 bacterium]